MNLLREQVCIILSWTILLLPSCGTPPDTASTTKEVISSKRDKILSNLERNDPEAHTIMKPILDELDGLVQNQDNQVVVVNKDTNYRRKANIKEIKGQLDLLDNEELFIGTEKSRYLTSIKFMGLNSSKTSVSFRFAHYDTGHQLKDRKLVNGDIIRIKTKHKSQKDFQNSINQAVQTINSHMSRTNYIEDFYGKKRELQAAKSSLKAWESDRNFYSILALFLGPLLGASFVHAAAMHLNIKSELFFVMTCLIGLAVTYFVIFYPYLQLEYNSEYQKTKKRVQELTKQLQAMAIARNIR